MHFRKPIGATVETLFAGSIILFASVGIAPCSLAAQLKLPPPPPEPVGVCVGNCNDPQRSSSSSTPSKSASEIKKEAEDKDLREAAEDANDKGIELYKKGDWEKAIKAFKEALGYAPDDPDMKNNLSRAEQKAGEARAREAEVGRQLLSAERHSQQAVTNDGLTSAKEASRGFDSPGTNAGTLPTLTVFVGNATYKNPVIPAWKRTPAITKLERDRDASLEKAKTLQQQLSTLDPIKNAVEASAVKQQQNVVQNQIHYLNFSITEQLRTPAPTTPTKPRP